MLVGAQRLLAGGAMAALLGCSQNVYLGHPFAFDAEPPPGDAKPPPADAKPPPSDAPPFPWPLHTVGSKIVDSSGAEVRLKGINWSGMETARRVPDGLHVRTIESIVAQIEKLGFNLIRIPFSDDSVSATSLPGSNALAANMTLAGATSLEVLDQILDAAAAHHLRVILDRYRFGATMTSPPPATWYSGPEPASTQGGYPEQEWIDNWVALAGRYSTRPNMVGCDLHDEPKNPSTWGDGNAVLDWMLAAERAGTAILAANSNLLIIVEGIDKVDGQPYWAGGNLRGAKTAPVSLVPASQLAYSIHDYGKSVDTTRPWFADPTFPDNMPALWTDTWGYLVAENTRPVIVGAFGDRKDEVGIAPDAMMADEAWRPALMSYVAANKLSFIFWALNPSAEGKTGLLEPDWLTPNAEWAAVLQLTP